MLNYASKISEENESLISGGDGKLSTGNAVGSDHSDSDDDWEGVGSTELDEIFSAATAFVAGITVDRAAMKVSNEIQLQAPALAFDANNFSLWGSEEWWMFLATQSMAIDTVMVRWVAKYSDPVMATGLHMVIGGLPLMAILILNHDPALSSFNELTTSDVLALLYSSIFGLQSASVSYSTMPQEIKKCSKRVGRAISQKAARLIAPGKIVRVYGRHQSLSKTFWEIVFVYPVLSLPKILLLHNQIECAMHLLSFSWTLSIEELKMWQQNLLFILRLHIFILEIELYHHLYKFIMDVIRMCITIT
ncbi:hypothetical protein ACS0TY_029074 [Phlomoides rotata]